MNSLKRSVARITASRLFSSSTSPSESQAKLIRRCRLLDASRGLLSYHGSRSSSEIPSSPQKRPLPVFPLKARHFKGCDQFSPTAGSLPPNTPKEFHQSLRDMIRDAKERVRIASLYIGPATSNKDDCEEAELLDALSGLVERDNRINTKNKKVSVKILLDENRALRPVPKAQTNHGQDNSKTTTSSAEAVARAIHGESSVDGDTNSSLHLFRVLPPTTISGKNWLPNPLDEIAGVFHIKVYIVDDQLLLSGANLSREYFRDRMDRYLHLIDGANGLVDFYAELVDILCRHSNEYNPSDGKFHDAKDQQEQTRREEFLQEISQHFCDPNYNTASLRSAQDLLTAEDDNDDGENTNEKIVAVGIPTFQAPAGYFQHKDCANAIPADIGMAWSTFWSLFRIDQQVPDKVDFVTDVDATLNLLKEAGNLNNSFNGRDVNYCFQLSSAYLNPTPSFLSVLQDRYNKVQLLSAGKISHGFKPKKKECNEGSQGKDWTIPSVFDKLVDECMQSLRSKSASNSSNKRTAMDAQLYFWERPEWTFHAKGIWLKEEVSVSNSTAAEIKGNGETSEVAAAVVGSSNFGYRSFYRDMESNLLLVFPPRSSFPLTQNKKNGDIASSFGKEWEDLLTSSKREAVKNFENIDSCSFQEEKVGKETDTAEKPPPLPWPILKSIPYVKTFF